MTTRQSLRNRRWAPLPGLAVAAMVAGCAASFNGTTRLEGTTADGAGQVKAADAGKADTAAKRGQMDRRPRRTTPTETVGGVQTAAGKTVDATPAKPAVADAPAFSFSGSMATLRALFPSATILKK